jgi:hypothetical protein
MMNPELKAKWIADLKIHPKIQGALHTTKGYCCLGVACITLGGNFELGMPRLDDRALDDRGGLNNHGLTLLGIDENDQSILVDLNDNTDTFEPIIKWIEANL